MKTALMLPSERFVRRHRSDLLALTGLIAVTLICAGFRFYYDNWLAGFDMFTYFLPTYEYMGQRLRDFEIPAWNPHFNSGHPAVGDPGAGWMYLPVMIGFTLFKAGAGIKAMVLIQALIGGISTYLFARRIGLIPVAAFFSATSFAIGPPLYDATGQSTVIGQVSAFIPLGLLATECALRATHRSARLAWSCLTGVAISQMFLAWPQGFLYGSTMIGAWMANRWLFQPLPGTEPRSERFRRTIESGVAMGITAATFGAAGILPRLDFSRNSNIPGGDYSDVIGGNYVEWTHSWAELLGLYLQESEYWRITMHSVTVLLLAVVAIVFARKQFAVPYFAVMTLLFMDLAVSPSLTRWFFYLLPPFELIHHHRPTATIYMVFLPFSILAGAGLQSLLESSRARARLVALLAPLAVVGTAMLVAQVFGHTVGPVQPVVAIVATLLILHYQRRLPTRFDQLPSISPRMVAAGFIVLLLIYPNGGDMFGTVRDPRNLPEYNDLLGRDKEIQDTIAKVMANEDPGTAAEFLQMRQASQPPFRYAWYLGMGYNDSYIASSGLRMEPGAVAALANGRAVTLGLEETAGYNPIHLEYYVEYATAMNGIEQNYHWLDPYEYAITSSQLLDMLNVRYVLVGATVPPDREDMLAIASVLTEVYRDDLVVVYENPYAFPRAWIVHDVRDNGDGAGLVQLGDKSANGHTVAFVNGPLPGVTNGDPASIDSATITSRSEESMTIRATANGDGLLVISEVYEHNWRAWVDGREVDILRTNHALRGIPIPNGTHTIELKYEPRALSIGLWLTGGATLGILAIWTWALVDWQRRSLTGNSSSA